MDRLILWTIRIGVILLIITNFFMRKKVSRKVLKLLDNKDNYYKSKQTKFVKYLDSLTDNNFFKIFKLKEGSETYKKTNDNLIKSGNENGLTIEIIQGMRVIIPIIIFIIGVIGIGALEAINKFALFSDLNNNEVVTSVYSFIEPVANTQSTGDNNSLKKLSLLLVITLMSYKLPDFYLKQKTTTNCKKILFYDLSYNKRHCNLNLLFSICEINF